MDPQTTKLLEIINNPKYAAVLLLLMIWALAWKGVALWKTASNGQKKWFVAILILNTFGILEIIYIFYFDKKKTAKNPVIDAKNE